MFEPLAKSADKGSGGKPETLEFHTHEVVRRLIGLMRRAPDLPRLCAVPNLWQILFWSAVMHDFGKVATGFQAMLRGEQKKYPHRHEVLSLAFLPWLSEKNEERLMTLAVISHHRDYAVIDELYTDTNGETLLEEISPEMVGWLAEWLKRVPNDWIDQYKLHEFGITKKVFAINLEAFPNVAARALERGIRAYVRVHPQDPPYPHEPEFAALQKERRLHILLRGFITQADRMASAAAPIPETLLLPDLATLMAQMSAREQKTITARDHQKSAEIRGNIVFSAPTGSGKTEAALGWAAKQPQPRRLNYALPYQASLNAMKTRLERDLQTEVAILHSRALQVLYRQKLETEDDQSERTQQVRRQNDYNRLHQPAVAVLTPYQMLKAAFRLSGYEGLLATLTGSNLVLDEIHAYEPQRLGMFLALIEMLSTDYAVHICAMTATMPSWLRQELERRLNTHSLEIPDAVFVASRRHRLELLDGDLEANLADVLQAVQRGQSVLVACNTVKKAQAIFAVLQNLLPERVKLLHSRFTANDRLKKELEIGQQLDAKLEQQEAIAVVATQVIEVSLDLDFDTIISEPAPLEALVQRFGRVNRRGKKGNNGIVPVYVVREPKQGQRVYDDRLIERGLAQLEPLNHTDLDDQIVSQALDKVYRDEVLRDFAGITQSSAAEFKRHTLDHLRAFERDKDLEHQFDKLFDGIEVLPQCYLEDYEKLLQTSPIEARGLLVNAPRWITGGLREFVQWSETLHLFVANLPYSPTLGMQWTAPPVREDAWGRMDD